MPKRLSGDLAQPFLAAKAPVAWQSRAQARARPGVGSYIWPQGSWFLGEIWKTLDARGESGRIQASSDREPIRFTEILC